MSAAERHKVHQETKERFAVMEDFRRVISVGRWLTYAGEHDLPSDPGRCSTEALTQALAALYPKPLHGEGTMALKKGTKTTETPKAAPAQAAKIFLITFPDGKPQKATAIVMEGDEPAAVTGTTQIAAASPNDLNGMPMPALLALVNAGKTGTPIRKFDNEPSAVAAAWDSMLTRAEPAASGVVKEQKARVLKEIAYPAKEKENIKQVRVGTKVATAVDLLSQDGGVLLSTFEQTLSQTGKPISGRAWLSYDVSKVVGYGVRSEPEGENDLRLFLVLPKGLKAPLAHKVAEEKKVPEPKPAKPVTEAPKSAKAKKAAEPVAAEPVVEAAPEPVKIPVAKKAAAKKSAK